jgi:Flp pilus assembly protein TadB
MINLTDGFNYKEIVGSLSAEEKKNIAKLALESLDVNAKKDVTASALNSLDVNAKKDVARSAGLSSPNEKTSNLIWLSIVIAFVVVFVVASTFLTIGVTILGKKADDVQVVLTIFTAVVAFFAGILTPTHRLGTK